MSNQTLAFLLFVYLAGALAILLLFDVPTEAPATSPNMLRTAHVIVAVFWPLLILFVLIDD